MVSWQTSHCITKHWRSNPLHCNTLAHQDTKSANHRASFPCVASPPLRPITFDVTACHATRYRTLRCCLRDCVLRPLEHPWTRRSSPRRVEGSDEWIFACSPPIVSCSLLAANTVLGRNPQNPNYRPAIRVVICITLVGLKYALFIWARDLFPG